MKISAIGHYPSIVRTNKNIIKQEVVKEDTAKPDKSNIFPAGYTNINFRNVSDMNKTLPKLWQEYKWYTYADKTPAVFSFLKIITKSSKMDRLLNIIFKVPEKSRDFFSSIAYNPRKSSYIMNQLPQVIPPESPNVMTFLPTSPYYKAYSEFMDWKVKDARSLEDLLRIRPDWKGEVLLNKYKELRHSDSLEIGNIPREIPREHLFPIVDYLSGQMEIGVKNKKKIADLKLDNRNYEFAFFTEGKSDKNVFGVFTPEGKKYVIKISAPELRSLDKPFALGTLAKIDSYLTYNRSRNAAPLCYYNHDKNFSIYKYIEHIPIQTSSANIKEIAKNMPDFVALGLTYNDTIGNKNFFRLAHNSTHGLEGTEGFFEGVNKGEWITVDNDHVTYTNRLMPQLSQYHAPLPNAMQMFF